MNGDDDELETAGTPSDTWYMDDDAAPTPGDVFGEKLEQGDMISNGDDLFIVGHDGKRYNVKDYDGE